MSIVTEGKAPCSKCGQQNTIKVYRSINTSEDPHLKEKVKDGSLFLWECPHCGQVNLARYETLYHDPEKKLMVWLVPEGDVSESQMKAISNHTKAMGGYTLRRVTDMGSLMEKVLINESGLDDVVLEMCKYVTKMEIASKMENNEKAASIMTSPFHFYRISGEDNERVMTFMYPYEGRMIGADVGFNVYEDCLGILERNPHIKPDEGFEKIDSEWLSSKMR